MKIFKTSFKLLIASMFVLAVLIMVAGCGIEPETPQEAQAAAQAAEKPAVQAEPAAPAVKEQAKPAEVQAPAKTEESTREDAIEPELPRSSSVISTVEPEEEPEPKTIEVSGYLDSKVKGLVERHQKIKSYTFYYATSQNWNLLRDQYFVKGNKIKVNLYEPSAWQKNNYFDTIYLDTAAKTAIAYCESASRDRCLDRTKSFEVNYDDYKIITPSDWINSVPYDAKWVGGETFDNRPADKIEYTRNDGATVWISADSFSGVPIMVEVFWGDIENLAERHAFRDLTVNTVKDAEIRLASD